MKSSRWNFSRRSIRSGETLARRTGLLLLFLLSLFTPSAYSQEKYEVDLAEVEKQVAAAADKPYSFGGFFEFQPTLLGLDRDSAFYRLRFFNRDRGGLFDQYNFRLRLEGSYKRDIFSAFFRTDSLVRNEFDGWNEDTKLFEGFVSAKPTSGFTLEAGKKILKWGKGYAWNPVNFIDRPKNPEDPTEALEGSIMATADFIWSFDGPMRTAALSTVLLPVYKHVNTRFGELNNVNFAAKSYFLLYDTDIDLMVLTGASRPNRYGFDFAKNLATNFVIHGEWAFIHNQRLSAIDRQGRVSIREFDAISYLLGLRYLTEKETTYILEYYRNGTGFSRSEMKDFFGFVEDSHRTFLATGDDRGLRQGRQLLDGAYGRPNPGRHYLYVRASQKQPFDILYLTPALTSIVNLTDGSVSLIPEIAYSPATNVDLRFRTAFLLGKERTEYGERQNDYRIELRFRYRFALDSVLASIF